MNEPSVVGRTTMESTDSVPQYIDLGPLLVPPQVPTSITSVMLRDDWGNKPSTDPNLVGEPILTGTIVEQTVTGLKPGATYRWRVTCAPSPPAISGQPEVLTADLIIDCFS